METGDPEITALVERFAAMGAPWTYGMRDVEGLAVNIGARVADRFTLAQLHRLYWPRKSPESRLFDYYSLCTLAAG